MNLYSNEKRAPFLFHKLLRREVVWPIGTSEDVPYCYQGSSDQGHSEVLPRTSSRVATI